MVMFRSGSEKTMKSRIGENRVLREIWRKLCKRMYSVLLMVHTSSKDIVLFPAEKRPEKNRPSGEADVFPFEIAILESSKSKHEITTMRLATDTMSQRAEWATAIQQATIFRRTNSIVSVPSTTDIKDTIEDEKSSGEEDLEDVNVTTESRGK